jgi:hypothetical protein
MKLRLFIVVVVISAALFSADASAALQLHAQVKNGVSTSSRSVSRSCGFRNDGYGLRLFCIGRTGKATARYDFYLPKNRYGTPAARVYGTKHCCRSSGINKNLVRITRRHYRIVVSVRRATRFVVRSVTLSYYVKT